MLHSQQSQSASALKIASDNLSTASAIAAFAGNLPLAGVLAGASASSNIAAGAISPEKGALPVSIAEEITGKAVSSKVEVVGEIGGYAARKFVSDDIKGRINSGTSEIVGEAVSNDVGNRMNSTKSTNSENGMSGSVIKICSGMGAQKDGCH